MKNGLCFFIIWFLVMVLGCDSGQAVPGMEEDTDTDVDTDTDTDAGIDSDTDTGTDTDTDTDTTL